MFLILLNLFYILEILRLLLYHGVVTSIISILFYRFIINFLLLYNTHLTNDNNTYNSTINNNINDKIYDNLNHQNQYRQNSQSNDTIDNGIYFLKYQKYLQKYLQYNNDQLYKTKLKLGKRLTLLLPKLGPAFVKLGQLIAIRSDLLDKVICDPLKDLHDIADPIPFKKIQFLLNQNNKSGTDNYIFKFQYIDPKPIGSASIAQVHKAITADGDTIALKILRPNIRQKFEKNLIFIEFIANIVERFITDTKRLKLKSIIKTIKQVSEIELNPSYECAAASKLRDNCKSNINVYIPKVFWKYCTNNIAAFEWIDGISIYDTKSLVAQGHKLDQLAENLILIFFQQAFNDGFFHADVHPGNILVNESGQIVLLDFGIIGFLPEKDRLYITQILNALIMRDYDRAAELHFIAQYVSANKSYKLFSLACRSAIEPIINKPMSEISIAKLIKRLFDITAAFGMETQPQLLLLQKTMIMIEGTVHSLNNDLNFWNVLKPWYIKWARDNLSLYAKIKASKKYACKAIEELEGIISEIYDDNNFEYSKDNTNYGKQNHQNGVDNPYLNSAGDSAGLFSSGYGIRNILSTFIQRKYYTNHNDAKINNDANSLQGSNIIKHKMYYMIFILFKLLFFITLFFVFCIGIIAIIYALYTYYMV